MNGGRNELGVCMSGRLPCGALDCWLKSRPYFTNSTTSFTVRSTKYKRGERKNLHLRRVCLCLGLSTQRDTTLSKPKCSATLTLCKSTWLSHLAMQHPWWEGLASRRTINRWFTALAAWPTQPTARARGSCKGDSTLTPQQAARMQKSPWLSLPASPAHVASQQHACNVLGYPCLPPQSMPPHVNGAGDSAAGASHCICFGRRVQSTFFEKLGQPPTPELWISAFKLAGTHRSRGCGYFSKHIRKSWN